MIGCYGDPALYAAREISPVPVVGTAEASMLMACPVAYRFSVVTVLPRVRPLIEDIVRMHGLESRCASVRTTPLSVLDCERDPDAAAREIVKRRARRSRRTARRRSASAAPAWARSTGGSGTGRHPGARRRRLRDQAGREPRRLRRHDEPGRVFMAPEPKEYVSYPKAYGPVSA